MGPLNKGFDVIWNTFILYRWTSVYIMSNDAEDSVDSKLDAVNKGWFLFYMYHVCHLRKQWKQNKDFCVGTFLMFSKFWRFSASTERFWKKKRVTKNVRCTDYRKNNKRQNTNVKCASECKLETTQRSGSQTSIFSLKCINALFRFVF